MLSIWWTFNHIILSTNSIYLFIFNISNLFSIDKLCSDSLTFLQILANKLIVHPLVWWYMLLLLILVDVLWVRIHSISHTNTHTITCKPKEKRHMKLITQFGTTLTYIWGYMCDCRLDIFLLFSKLIAEHFVICAKKPKFVSRTSRKTFKSGENDKRM